MPGRRINDGSPFHAGEQAVQERLGVRDIEQWARQVVRPTLPAQHRAFHAALPFMVAAARDDVGRPWATLLSGPEGFITSPDARMLVLNAAPVAGDALSGALLPGRDLGLLGIELASRRRNRVNGKIAHDRGGVIGVAVDQSFGNCPQYIHARAWRRVETVAGEPWHGAALTAAQQDWIHGTDTMFIASGYGGAGERPGDSDTFGMDASHRGGEPGFVEVAGATRLVFPDYAGNNHFNTIGNIVADPRVGLLFVDFATGSLLQLTGRATIDWDSDAVARHAGAQRLVIVDIEAVVELPGAVALRWDAEADSVRTLRLIDKIRESDDVTSFVFAARDGGPLAPWQAGQHLPIELDDLELGKLTRTYSLSGAPEDDTYRISVKREPHGQVSRYLHDFLTVGDFLNARKPAGDFVVPHGTRPVVLVSAGVGVTPMVAMAHELAQQDGERPVWFVHGARDGAHHPLADEVRSLADERMRVHVAFSAPRADDRFGSDYDGVGRVDGTLIAELVGDQDADYLLCGPTPFMAGVSADLRARGVAAERIHTETFGPVSSSV